jgi:hypothetical protein
MSETLLVGENTQVANEQPVDVPVQNEQAAQPETPPQVEESVKEETVEEVKTEGAPEKYEFIAPEGKQYDSAVIDAFSEVARELNLSNENAQKLIDRVNPVMQARTQEQLSAMAAQWENDAKADKEFGGDKLNENLGVAKKAMDMFASSELKALLRESGLGSHPEIIRTFFKIGKQVSSDGFVNGEMPAVNADKSAAKVLYPNQS